ncbi:hypothetical protein [Afifella aestuarii]|uniref:hypothetical protein n=1 Tax=Afifella aestuarii TaxID=1909496 RepID=UPI000FE3919D|nr:hypothetical protein [Afifella aestuarii]
MIRFFRIFWAVFWRSIFVLTINAGISYGIARMARSLFVQTEFFIKTRASIGLLPAAIIFTALAVGVGSGQSIILERRSPMSLAQWQQTYFAMAACALIVMISIFVVALTASADFWFAFRVLFSLPMFLLFWIGVSIWQTNSRKT